MASTEISKQMTSMSYKKNIKVHQGHFKMPLWTKKWTKKNEFMTADDCKFSVWMRSKESCKNSPTEAYTLHISIRKNNWEPVAASVSISFGLWKETSTSEEWTWSLDFPEVKLSSADYNAKDYLLIIVFDHFEFLKKMDKPPRSNLCNYLPKFWIDSIFSDVIIRVGDEKFKAHKLVLASQSPVFLKIFENSAEEFNERPIVIENVEPKVMKEVLAFLYSGCDDFRHNADMILNIMIVAYKYEIENLHKACQYRLFEKMATDNVLKIVDIADDHNAKELRDNCLSFMRGHREEIILMDDFRPLAHKKIDLLVDFTVSIVENP